LAGARTETELRVAADLSHRAAHEPLASLERLGLITSATRSTTGRGRPPREWELTQKELVSRFAEQAEEFARALKRKA
jgi:predicted ArsR family transcriptional regulator